MGPLLGKWKEEIYVLMRIMMGFMLACHGVQKLFGLLEGEGHPHGLWLAAGVIEFVGGSLVMLGLFASPAAFILSGEMAVAYFMVHAHLRFWPILNGGEIVVANCFAFLYIAAKGAGILSVDSWFDSRQAILAAQERSDSSASSAK
jgi:putative oxidoreductase